MATTLASLIELSNKYSETLTTTTQIYLGQAYAKSGERKKARSILGELKRTNEPVSPVELAILYSALGENLEAMTSLEWAYSVRDAPLQFLKVEAGLDDLRSDERFKAILKLIGLA